MLSTEHPCRNCASANKACTYAVRDKKVTVSESYLRSLAGDSSGSISFDGAYSEVFRENGPKNGCTETVMRTRRPGLKRTYDSLVENTTAELFVTRLKKVKKLHASMSPDQVFTAISESSSTAAPDVPRSLSYEYVALSYDNSCMSRNDVRGLAD